MYEVIQHLDEATFEKVLDNMKSAQNGTKFFIGVYQIQKRLIFMTAQVNNDTANKLLRAIVHI